MSDIAVCLLFLAAIGFPFVTVFGALGVWWLCDRAWRQW